MIPLDTKSIGAAPTAVWDRPHIVGGFARSTPNLQLMAFARARRRPWAATRVLDIGCGAGRNAVPLATEGFDVIGIDLSRPMLAAASGRNTCGRMKILEGCMDDLPIRSRSIDLVIAHGIWNLAGSDAEFFAATTEAARVAAPGAALFVFTFSRQTLPPDAVPVGGQRFTYDQFSGEPQIFLTREQLIIEMRATGFEPDRDFPLRELNLPPDGRPRLGGAPVILEAAFRKTGA